MRKYRPFLIYNPAKGWAFYLNTATVSPLTSRNIGGHRKKLRKVVGWFVTADLAIMFEARSRAI